MTKEETAAEREKRMAKWLAKWKEQLELGAKRRQELHDRLREDYGIETAHTLAEIKPENHFSYTDKYTYPIIKWSKGKESGDRHYRAYVGTITGGETETDPTMKHLVQDEDWQPKLIKRGDSPYVLSESEQKAALVMEQDNAFTQQIKASFDCMDERVEEEREKS